MFVVVGYIVLAFVTTYFTAALVAGANNVLSGQPTSLGTAFAAANAKLHRLLPWALVQATVSMIIQALVFAWVYPKLFSTRREDWLASAGRFALVFGTLAWSFMTLPVAAKYNMTSVADFLKLETAFTAVQYAVVAPLVALVWRDPRVPVGAKLSAT